MNYVIFDPVTGEIKGRISLTNSKQAAVYGETLLELTEEEAVLMPEDSKKVDLETKTLVDK